MKLVKLISGLAAASLCLLAVPAAGQQPGAPTVATGSDSTETRLLVPVWSFNTTTDKMFTSMGSKMNVRVDPGGGMLLNSRISVSKRSYKTRDMTDINESFLLSGIRQEEGIYNISFTASDDYRATQSVSIARFGKDIVYEDKKVSASFSYFEPLFSAGSSNLDIYGEYNEGMHDFKYDKKFSLKASGKLSYNLGEHLSISGNYGKLASSEDSRISYLYYESMPTSIDTLTFNSGYRKNDQEFLKVSYQKTQGEINRVEPPRGNALQVIDNPELAKKDIIKILSENLNVTSAYMPTGDVTVRINFDHRLEDNNYLVDQRLSKTQETDNLSARTEYRFSARGNASVVVSKKTMDVDYGPTSVSAYREDEERVMFNASQSLGEDFKISLSGQTYLKQRFYKKYEENPRDVDNLYFGGRASLEAKPFGAVETTVDVEASKYDIINIDASLSSDNRARYIYRLLPVIMIRPREWLDLTQRYEVKIEYTEYTFDENRNFIDRTVGVETDAGVSFPGKKISFGFNHRYNMRDTGSYLDFEGERRYNRSSEDLRHEFRLKMNYLPVDYLRFSTDNTLRFRESNSLGVEDGVRVVTGSRTYESGTFRIGVKGKKDVMFGANLDLNLYYIRNFGERITKEMREYVDAKMSLSYQF